MLQYKLDTCYIPSVSSVAPGTQINCFETALVGMLSYSPYQSIILSIHISTVGATTTLGGNLFHSIITGYHFLIFKDLEDVLAKAISYFSAKC